MDIDEISEQDEDTILQRMLSNVSDDYDKREGSIIYDSLAPASVEAAIIYSDLADANEENDIDTASRDTVIAKCAERTISPKEASPAVLKVKWSPSDISVPKGNRFNSETTTYVVTGDNEVTCEENGVIGNEYIGEILPIDNVAGLESATIVSVEVYGEEEESTESLRERYHNSFGSKSFGGNKAQYREYTRQISGVGGVKVIAAGEKDTDGVTDRAKGTTKLVIISSAYTPASDKLVKTVQNYFDPNQDGKGDGMSPVGDHCTVVSAEGVTVNITASITFDTGYDFSSLSSSITSAIKTYVDSVAKEWEKSTSHIIRLAKIESAIVGITGVLDVSSVKINDEPSNLILTEYKIPVMGVVSND